MSKKQNAIKFNINKVAGNDQYTLIPVGRYTGKVEQAKMVVTRQGEERLWVGFRIDGPTQAGRFITTLCTLNDADKSAYKTAGLGSAAPEKFDAFLVDADPKWLEGAEMAVDVVIWTPSNSGAAINDIRNFISTNAPVDITKFVAEVAESLSIPDEKY